ncbi:hypothetical protein [Yoonia sp. MH D7]
MAEDKNPKDQPPKMAKDTSVAGAKGKPDSDDPLVTGVSHTRKTADEIAPTEGYDNDAD